MEINIITVFWKALDISYPNLEKIGDSIKKIDITLT